MPEAAPAVSIPISLHAPNLPGTKCWISSVMLAKTNPQRRENEALISPCLSFKKK